VPETGDVLVFDETLAVVEVDEVAVAVRLPFSVAV
jgi:hypothetical protein